MISLGFVWLFWAGYPVQEPSSLQADLHLNEGQRWQLDESTRLQFEKIRSLLKAKPEENLAAYQEQAHQMWTAVQAMIQGCSMQGEAHNQLHHVLTELIPAIQTMQKSASLTEAQSVRSKIAAILGDVDRYFQ
ncbi:MAG: hypothetical protein KDC71_22370 [Acidobacteria bacterium]|nr:hypothetical protein [Acidobacteriota bacterium]